MKKILFILCFGLVACDDFLQEYSQNKVYAKSAEDLLELLVGEGYMQTYRYSNTPYNFSMQNPYFPMLHVMDDDVEEDIALNGNFNFTATDASAINLLGAFYRWERVPFVDAALNTTDDNNWSRLYGHISILNVIISYRDKIIEEEGNSELLETVIGEAYFLRAYYYFLLANVYGLPYNKETASQDCSVPLKVSEYIEDRYFIRDDVAGVFEQIILDLENASAYLLGKTPKNIHRPSYAAAQALLSRVYLHVEDYENVVRCSDEVEKMAFVLLDLNSTLPEKGFLCASSSEMIFSQGSNCMKMVCGGDDWGQQPGWWNYGVACGFKASQDLISCYGVGDMRLEAFFSISIAGNYIPYKYKGLPDEDTDEVVSDIFALRLGEVILNKAEALAMLGRDGEACEYIDMLREKRLTPESFEQISMSGEKLIDFIREERRRELCFEGHRWFDLRRYAVNEKYPFTKVIDHAHYLLNVSDNSYYKAGYYRLDEYANEQAAYVLPIPNYEIEFNNGSLENLERKDRVMIME